MDLLTKKELQEEVIAIDESINAHTQQKELHEKMIKRENYLKTLINKEIAKFK